MSEATPALHPTRLYGVDTDYFTFLPEDFLQVLRYKVKEIFFCQRDLNHLAFLFSLRMSETFVIQMNIWRVTCEMVPQMQADHHVWRWLPLPFFNQR
jgi:hypothetical protein